MLNIQRNKEEEILRNISKSEIQKQLEILNELKKDYQNVLNLNDQIRAKMNNLTNDNERLIKEKNLLSYKINELKLQITEKVEIIKILEDKVHH